MNYAVSFLSRIFNVAPMQSFFEYMFKRISNDLLDSQPEIVFKNGVLELNNLPISTTKVNNQFLASSPYVMHEGSLRKLRIVLPNLSDLVNKSIEISIEGLHLILKPNKEFQKRFNEKIMQIKQIMLLLRENSKYYEDDEAYTAKSDDTSVDFFRQVIKQILTNIKVTIRDVSVRLFMNRPSEKNTPVKPQYYLFLRMPCCNIEKSDEGKSANTDKFKVWLPQLFLHLLREDMKIPEYSNMMFTPEDFPSRYPTVNHPSTLMLVGTDDLSQNTRGITVILKIIRKQEENKIQKVLLIDATNIEFMVDGVQLRVLSKFLKQLEDFKTLYSKSMENLKKQDRSLYKAVALEVSQDIDLTKMQLNRSTFNMNSSHDIFTSLMINQLQPRSTKRVSQQPDYLTSILLNEDARELKKEINDFAKKVNEDDKKVLMNQETMKSQTQLSINVQVFCFYILKYNNFTLVEFERTWLPWQKGQPQKINTNIPSSYFMLKIQNTNLRVEDKTINISLRKIELFDVNIGKKQKQVIKETTTDFKTAKEGMDDDVDIFQSFKGLQVKEDMQEDKPVKALIKFEKQINQHYCCNVLLSISASPPKPYSQSTCIKYAFYEASQAKKDILPGTDGLTIRRVDDETIEKMQITLKFVLLSTDLVVIRDFINIMHPLFMYRAVVENINLKTEQINMQQENEKKVNNIHYSMYDIDRTMTEEDMMINPMVKPQKQNLMDIRFDCIKLLFRQSDVGSNLAEKDRCKEKDKQSYGGCVCGYKGMGLSLTTSMLQVKFTSKIRINFGSLDVKIVSLDREVKPLYSVVSIEQSKDNGISRVFVQNTPKQQNSTIFITNITLNLIEPTTIRVLQLATNTIKQLKQLKMFYQYMKEQLSYLENATNRRNKQSKEQPPNTQTNIHIGLLVIKLPLSKLVVRDLAVFTSDKNTVVQLTDIVMLKENNRTFLREIEKHNDKMTEYDENYEFGDIYSAADVILAVRSPKANMQLKPTYQSEHKQYAKQLLLMSTAIKITVSMEQAEEKNKPVRHGIRDRQLETIHEEEGHYQCISVDVEGKFYVRICQLVELLDPLKKIKDIFMSYEFEKMAETPQRKMSEEVVQPKKQININVNNVTVDVFPVFEKRPGIDIMANTRSIIVINKIFFGVVIATLPDQGQTTTIKCQIPLIEWHFLRFLDSKPQYNPIFISDFARFGFHRLLECRSVKIDVRIRQISQTLSKIELSPDIEKITIECTSKAITYLLQHLKIITANPNENILNKSVISYDIYEISDEDAEDIQKIGQVMIRLEKERNLEEIQFLKNQLHITPKTGKQPSLKIFTFLRSVSITIFSGDDFDFHPPGYVDDGVVFLNDEIENIQDDGLLRRVSKDSFVKSTNLRIISEQISLQIHKYLDADMAMKLQLRNISCIVNKHREDMFYILNSKGDTAVLIDISEGKIKINCSEPRLNIGFTSNLSFLMDDMEEAEKIGAKTYFWMKEQPVEEEDTGKSTEIFLLVPECTLTLNLDLKGFKLLKSQIMNIPELYFNSRLGKIYANKNWSFFKDWIKTVLTRNLGSLLGNGVVTLITKLIELLMILSKKAFLLPWSILRFARR